MSALPLSDIDYDSMLDEILQMANAPGHALAPGDFMLLDVPPVDLSTLPTLDQGAGDVEMSDNTTSDAVLPNPSNFINSNNSHNSNNSNNAHHPQTSQVGVHTSIPNHPQPSQASASQASQPIPNQTNQLTDEQRAIHGDVSPEQLLAEMSQWRAEQAQQPQQPQQDQQPQQPQQPQQAEQPRQASNSGRGRRPKTKTTTKTKKRVKSQNKSQSSASRVKVEQAQPETRNQVAVAGVVGVAGPAGPAPPAPANTFGNTNFGNGHAFTAPALPPATAGTGFTAPHIAPANMPYTAPNPATYAAPAPAAYTAPAPAAYPAPNPVGPAPNATYPVPTAHIDPTLAAANTANAGSDTDIEPDEDQEPFEIPSLEWRAWWRVEKKE